MFFGLFDDQKRIKELESKVKNSFSSVREDTQTLFEWIKFLYGKIEDQEQELEVLREQMEEEVLTPEDIKEVMNNYLELEEVKEIKETINKIEKKTDILASLHDSQSEKVKELNSRLQNVDRETEKKESSLKEKIAEKVTRNSKSYIKNTILSYIEKYEEIPAVKLREMLVEEQNICSRSSFYRLLRELENDGEVSFVKEGRKKIYYPKETIKER